MRSIVAWSRSSESGPSRGRSATQRRVERFAFGFDFDAARRGGAGARLAFAAFFVGVERFAAGVATGAVFAATAFAGTTWGTGLAGMTGLTSIGAAVGGFTIGRELGVLGGGSGCFRGRPLFRAACASAINLSKAALASASSRACCEFREVTARSFSALKRSSGFMRMPEYVTPVLLAGVENSAEAGQGEGMEVDPALAVERQLRRDLTNGSRELEAVPGTGAHDEHLPPCEPVDQKVPVRRVGIEADARFQQPARGTRHYLVELPKGGVGFIRRDDANHGIRRGRRYGLVHS